jgi:hypothetical protein
MSLAAGAAATGGGFAAGTGIVIGPDIFMFASGDGIVVGDVDVLVLLQPTTPNPATPHTSKTVFVAHRINQLL